VFRLHKIRWVIGGAPQARGMGVQGGLWTCRAVDGRPPTALGQPQTVAHMPTAPAATFFGVRKDGVRIWALDPQPCKGADQDWAIGAGCGSDLGDGGSDLGDGDQSWVMGVRPGRWGQTWAMGPSLGVTARR
jgi:hypothetical protein